MKKMRWGPAHTMITASFKNLLLRNKKSVSEIVLIADCCLCEYTSHGHCGVMKDGRLDNDKTFNLLQKIAVSYAANGVDIVAPSGMMDGMIQAIRRSLDQQQLQYDSNHVLRG